MKKPSEIREMFFNNRELYMVIGLNTYTNAEAIRILYVLEGDDIPLNVEDKGDHLLISK